MAEEGRAVDRRAGAFLARLVVATFPFWSIGAGFGARSFLGALAMDGHHTFPIRNENGNDLRDQ
jgi:hypothetical protein